MSGESGSSSFAVTVTMEDLLASQEIILRRLQALEQRVDRIETAGAIGQQHLSPPRQPTAANRPSKSTAAAVRPRGNARGDGRPAITKKCAPSSSLPGTGGNFSLGLQSSKVPRAPRSAEQLRMCRDTTVKVGCCRAHNGNVDDDETALTIEGVSPLERAPA